jgi:hypothetical protein
MNGFVRNVLVVAPDPVERERIAAALEGDGFQTLHCSGPSGPDYTCVGARSGRCPLASDDSVVVLDMDLDSNGVVSGTSAEDLLGFYLEGGHRVVTLNARPTHGNDDDRVLSLRRHPETDVLLAAVWCAAAPITRRTAFEVPIFQSPAASRSPG